MCILADILIQPKGLRRGEVHKESTNIKINHLDKVKWQLSE